MHRSQFTMIRTKYYNVKHLGCFCQQKSQTNRKAVQSTLNCFPIGQWLAVNQKEGELYPEDLPIFNLLNILVLRQ